jgi:hypothetical protein
VFRSFPGGFRLFGFSRLRAFGFRLASLCHVRAPWLASDCASQSLPILGCTSRGDARAHRGRWRR